MLAYLRSEAVVSSENGANVQQIVQAFGGQFAEPELRRAIDKAMIDGHCYSTIDDQTFKCV
jgi:hypothetical protein